MKRLAPLLLVAVACSGGGTKGAAPSPTPNPTPAKHLLKVAADAKPCAIVPLSEAAQIIGPIELEGELINASEEPDFCLLETTQAVPLFRLGYHRLPPEQLFVATPGKGQRAITVPGLPAGFTRLEHDKNGDTTIRLVTPSLEIYVADASHNGGTPTRASMALLLAAHKRIR